MFNEIIDFYSSVAKDTVIPTTWRSNQIAGYEESRDRSGNIHSIKVYSTVLEIDPRTDRTVNKIFYLQKDEAERFIQWFRSNSY